jgi:hypothetical protein
MLPGMREGDYESDKIAAYGATEQPAIAARMAPHLRMIAIGAVAALGAVLTSAIALAAYPSFSANQSGLAGAVVALVSATAMLAVCVIQIAVWRRAMASWRGLRIQDLHGEARLSWIAHVLSYAVALAALFSSILGSAYAGWSSTSAVLLALTLLLVLAAQVLGGVQYLRPGGPPGTLPAHMRRLAQRMR